MGDWAVALGNLAVTHGVWDWEVQLELFEDQSKKDEEEEGEGGALKCDDSLRACIGVAPYNVARRGPIFNHEGWWLMEDGQLIRQGHTRPYFDEGFAGKKKIKVGIHLDMDQGSLSFTIKGKETRGPAFTDLPKDIPLSLCVAVHSTPTAVQIIDSKH